MTSQDERKTYTVRELINALQDIIGDYAVEVYSGCHDCGGGHLEVDIYGSTVQIIGHRGAPDAVTDLDQGR